MRRRIDRLEQQAGAEHGICVACLRAGQCQRLQWQGTRRCGKARNDLPDVLFLEAPGHQGQKYGVLVVPGMAKDKRKWQDQVRAAQKQLERKLSPQNRTL